MKKLIVIAAAALTAVAAPAFAQEAAQKAGCMNCHAADTKKMGPSFKDIAAKFKGKDATADLVAKLTSGKGHPAVKAPAADVEAAVKAVLAM